MIASGKTINHSILFVLIAFTLFNCNSPSKPADEGTHETIVEGPYFGNGFRNGWADQQSIVIWTRLTTIPDLNQSGVHFKELNKNQRDSLDKSADKEAIHKAQIPEGYTLDQMDASCPGSNGEVKLTYYPVGKPESKVETSWNAVDQSKNFTKQWQLNDLKANTSYAVSIQARKDGNSDVSDTIEGVFKTAPSSTDVEPINFTVVTGHDYNRRDDPENGHKIYNSMMDEDLDFYVHTGDIEYYDKYNPWAMTEEMMRYKWDRLFALPFQRKFYANTTSYFIKDDHDVLSDDSHPGMTYGTVSFERGLEIFDQEQFPSADKTYKTVRWGKDLQVWIVEGRRYRSKNTDPDGPDKTIWGEEQKQWLYSTLKESDATYKIIISATPILGPDRSNKKDNHANVAFKQEGDEIREFINQFDNVFLAVGDRHWQYVSHLEGTNLWEFSCGPGSDEHAGGWDQGNLLPEHKFLRVKGGYLRVRVFREDEKSKIRFEHHDVDGNVVNEKVFGE